MIEVIELYLFIFESIGTSELLLIGVVALMFLGPRKMPEMAKKIGKLMADFKNTTSDFKETWEREVNFDEEVKSLNLNELEATPVARDSAQPDLQSASETVAPTIKEVDPATFKNPLAPVISSVSETDNLEVTESEKTSSKEDLQDKRNWL